ncbi:MAG: hypothetical protein LBT87_02415 [Treponema sp.]|jgi:hypothetical protein|nr:hypothetical protein [Treponema sp.]
MMMTAEEAAEAAKGLSFEKVWAIIQESARRQEEVFQRLEEMSRNADRREAEVSRRIEESSRNADRRIEESSRDADRRIEESSRDVDRRIEETWKRIEREQEKTERIVKRLSKNIGGVNNSLGRWIEKMVSAKLWEKFNAIGYVFTKGGPCELIENNRILTQVDIFLENGEYAMPVEVKTNLTEEDIDEHLERIEKIRGYMDKRNDKRKLVGAVAGAIVPENVQRYAFIKGLYVLVQSGKSIALAERPDSFSAREW